MKAHAPLVQVNEITHVCIVVKDVLKTIESFWNILGIGPWDVYPWAAPEVRDRTYHGRPAWSKEMWALAKVGGIGLELAQAVEGDSIYRDFVVEHGEGLHHLSFNVDDLDAVKKKLECFPNLQGAKGGAPGSDWVSYYNYFDIPPLRCIWEPVQFRGGTEYGHFTYPDIARTSPAKVKVKEITHACLVVKDIMRTIENFWSIFGIGPWDVYDWEHPQLRDRIYHGKPAWGREKIAMTKVGQFTLELAQPVEGDSIYRDFLAEHGEGLHHLSFIDDDLDKVAKALEVFPDLQRAHGGPEGKEAWAYHYFDIEPLHSIWEPVWVSGGPIGEGIRYPEVG